MIACLSLQAILLYNDREHDLAEDLVHQMVKRAIEMEGTATGEHGVGLVKRDYLEHELGQTTVDLMRKVCSTSTHYRPLYSLTQCEIKMKQAFDPLCLLNCDKVVRSQPGEIQKW